MATFLVALTASALRLVILDATPCQVEKVSSFGHDFDTQAKPQTPKIPNKRHNWAPNPNPNPNLLTIQIFCSLERSGAEVNTERCANFPTTEILYCIGVSTITTPGTGRPGPWRPASAGG